MARYEIVRRLTVGGMAELMLARATSGPFVSQPLAMKLLLPHLAESDDTARLFAQEAAIASRLDHPNIVRVLDTGEINGRAFFVMPFLEGLDLRELSRRLWARDLKLPPGLACAVAARIAKALAYAHRATDESGNPLELVHRDVSPHNVMLTRTGEVKVFDFGIAKTRVSATRTGLVRGKAGYMAPEQLSGLRVDGRTDLFALGVVLWEMLTGTSLFQRDTETGTARAVRDTAATPPSLLVPDCAGSLDGLVMALLAKFPAGRPKSADVVSSALDAEARSRGILDPAGAVAGIVATWSAAT